MQKDEYNWSHAELNFCHAYVGPKVLHWLRSLEAASVMDIRCGNC